MNVDLFELERGERAVYASAGTGDLIPLPMTRDGFEGLLQAAIDSTKAGTFPLPDPNDSLRAVLAGYIHHIGNETSTVTLERLATILHKSISNVSSWRIDQEIKAKARAAQAAAAAEAEANKPPRNRAQRRAKASALRAVTLPTTDAKTA